MEKQALVNLTEKLAGLQCADGFDETALLYPETEAWNAVVARLCDKLRCGCTLDKFFKEEAASEGTPTSVQSTQQLLDALCIEATEQQIQGSGSVESRAKFLDYLTDITLAAVSTARGERCKEAAARDARLLGVASASVTDLTAGDINLFKRYPEIHSVVQAAKELQQEEEKPLRSKLGDAQAALKRTEAMFEGLDSEAQDIDVDELRGVCASLEHSIGAFVAGAAEFHAIYSREIEPWTASAAAPSTQGLGPLAKDVDLRYANFRQVLQACSTLKASYEQLLARHEAAAAGYMPHVLSHGPATARELSERAAALGALGGAVGSSKLLTTDSL